MATESTSLEDMQIMVLEAFNDFNLAFEPEKFRSTCRYKPEDMTLVLCQAPIMHLRISDECDGELIAVFEWPWSQGDYPSPGIVWHEPAKLRQLTIIADTHLTTLIYDGDADASCWQADKIPSALRGVDG